MNETRSLPFPSPHQRAYPGLLISFEGIDGSGKSTQIKKLSEALADGGTPVIQTKEPGGTPLGLRLRSLLLDPGIPVHREAELFLFMADRAQHVKEVLIPALRDGEVVLSDRLHEATMAYQGFGAGLPRDFVALLNRFSMDGLDPDLTVLLDLPVSALESRILSRAEGRTRFESLGRDYFDRVRSGYLEIARIHRARTLVLDATRSPEDLHGDIRTALARRFPERFGR